MRILDSTDYRRHSRMDAGGNYFHKHHCFGTSKNIYMVDTGVLKEMEVEVEIHEAIDAIQLSLGELMNSRNNQSTGVIDRVISWLCSIMIACGFAVHLIDTNREFLEDSYTESLTRFVEIAEGTLLLAKELICEVEERRTVFFSSPVSLGVDDESLDDTELKAIIFDSDSEYDEVDPCEDTLEASCGMVDEHYERSHMLDNRSLI